MEINDCSGKKDMTLPISVIILTYNEEKNIADCLESVKGLAEEIFVVDSYSNDKTLEIAEKYTDKIFQNTFDNYSQQRNWALQNLPIKTEWIMNLDADHRVTHELKEELSMMFQKESDSKYDGFLVSRRTIFMGRWIKHGGHYPVYHAALFRRGFGSCEDKLYDQHFLINGKVKVLKGDIVDIITDSLTSFTQRHNRWATLEAFDQLLTEDERKDTVRANMRGHEMEKRRYLRETYYKFPLFIRAVLFYLYRYFLKLGFLDGKEGLIFHFLQGFWFRFLVDAKIYEIQKMAKSENRDVQDVIQEMYDLKVRG